MFDLLITELLLFLSMQRIQYFCLNVSDGDKKFV